MYEDNTRMNERELVMRLIDGDEEAFQKLYVNYKDRLQYFAFSFLKSSDNAEDIVQDVFTNLWIGRRMIDPDIPFSAYLYVIVKNRVLNQIRDIGKRNLLREQILTQAIDFTEATQDEILSADLKELIRRAIDTLTPRQQEIFKLSREGCLSYKEIAAKLNISVNTVHEHIATSLHIIRTFLLKYSDTRVDIYFILLLLNI